MQLILHPFMQVLSSDHLELQEQSPDDSSETNAVSLVCPKDFSAVCVTVFSDSSDVSETNAVSDLQMQPSKTKFLNGLHAFMQLILHPFMQVLSSDHLELQEQSPDDSSETNAMSSGSRLDL